ncbi:MAG: SDR family oxidoreductase [Thermoanaerobaculia bacterium]
MSIAAKEVARRMVFLTGASGVVGRALLAKMDPRSVICLVRQTSLSVPGVATVSGDISLPRFGWSSEQWRDMAARIDCIVHAAAVTDFHKPEAKIMRANVHSLENVFELAAAAKAPLYHFSTAFVRPTRTAATEEELAYAVSKREGERLVRESGLPAVILRPSIVIGDSASGVIARFQGFHSVVGGVLDGFLPIVPASRHAFIDCIPQDVVAEVTLALIAEGRTGGEHWITAGERALTTTRICEILEQFMIGLGGSFTVPRFVTPDMVQRLLRPVFLPALPIAMQKRFERLFKISTYLLIEERFPSSLPELSARLDLSPFPDLDEAVLRGLGYWANASGFGKRRAAA